VDAVSPNSPPRCCADETSGGDGTIDPVFTGLDMSVLPSVPPLESAVPQLGSPPLRGLPSRGSAGDYGGAGIGSKFALPRLPLSATAVGDGRDDLGMGGGDSSGGTRVHETIEEGGDDGSGLQQAVPLSSGSPALESGGGSGSGREHALGTPGVYAAGPPSPRL
jgi:hypothetical protein